MTCSGAKQTRGGAAKLAPKQDMAPFRAIHTASCHAIARLYATTLTSPECKETKRGVHSTGRHS